MERVLKALFPADFLTARYLLIRAAALLALFVAAHLAGWREHTTFLSGTTEGGDPRTSLILSTLYMLVYFCAVVLAPILALAAGLLWALSRWRRPKRTDQNGAAR